MHVFLHVVICHMEAGLEQCSSREDLSKELFDK